ncbi:MAG: fibronectin type III domain-containing protein [Ignavibacteria bacterium]
MRNQWSVISATPTAAELSTQQTDNTNTFGATPQNALSVIPASNTMLAFTTPVQSAPASPTALTFTGTSSTTTTLNWVDNSSNETGFPVYISTNNVNFSYLGTAAANTNNVQITGLALNTQYYFQVWASNETKYSAASANGNVTTLNLTNPMSGAYTINPSNPATGTNPSDFLTG